MFTSLCRFGLVALILVSFAAALTMAADAAPTTMAATASAPSTEPVMVPPEVFAKMEATVRQAPDPNTPVEEAKAMFAKNLKSMIQIAEQAEKDYPTAANLYVVQFQVLRASDMLGQITSDKAYETQAKDAAKRIIASAAPNEVKIQADMYLMRDALSDTKAAADALTKQVRAFMGRYSDTPVKPIAVVYGTLMAMEVGLTDLTVELLEKLKAEHADHPLVQDFLKRVNFGKEFAVELTKLDGSKLAMPKDLAGKLVVIDFWASWCPPCRKDVPEMKELYTQYKAKGVEFVGISLDRQKEDAQQFITENKMDWVQTYDGDQNPTAIKYNIANIPTVWVIGKDGKVLSDNARGRLPQVLDRALGTPASMPASAPAAK